jgi:NAD(P)H-dependent FMN reductase
MQDVKVKVIVGSTRQQRFSEKPARWIYEEIKKEAGVQAELLDLRDYPMPFFESPESPSRGNGKYADPAIQKWADKINDADAFIIVTPEYNHGYPAVLKNALDVIFPEWNGKAVGFLSYGSAGGARSIEQLRQVVIELQMLPIRNAISVPVDIYMKAMNAPADPELFAPLRKGPYGDPVAKFFSQLIWSAKALKVARR